MPLKIKYSYHHRHHHHHHHHHKVITPRNYALKHFNHRLADLVAGNRTKVFSSMLRTIAVTRLQTLSLETEPKYSVQCCGLVQYGPRTATWTFTQLLSSVESKQRRSLSLSHLRSDRAVWSQWRREIFLSNLFIIGEFLQRRWHHRGFPLCRGDSYTHAPDWFGSCRCRYRVRPKLLSSMVILLVYKMYDELLCKQADRSVTAERMFVSCRCQTCCVVLAPVWSDTRRLSESQWNWPIEYAFLVSQAYSQ